MRKARRLGIVWSVRRLSMFCALLAGVGITSSAIAVPSVADRHAVESVRSASRAIGRPSQGRLARAVQVRASSELYFNRATPDDERWGTSELVRMIQRAAARVAFYEPGSQLLVGDLSRRNGGWLPPHSSHRNGRDVDLGFFALNPEGGVVRPEGFTHYRNDGRARNRLVDHRFDEARNWRLVESLLVDPNVIVEAIFVSNGLKRRLLREARRVGTPRDVYHRAGRVMYQPRRGGRHDSHFHVRIYCPLDDRPQCEDREPYWPWHPAAIAQR